ncbi:glucose 1-dehydrogenase [Pseudonocardia eucalypti]|uniref:Glucose 1-dehydrogenase n=1 Tax=Pseudonocardia eucalypti TaxID=648755 RepID=A0ABP9PLI5_9PSEU|nr:NAD(P)-dependent dehydrogenase (short-subunit alcohol dehydrogenase family) [Pseudonocardia eucalypti]
MTGNEQLAGKVAIITGGTSGLGARMAELFAAEGAGVVVTGRRREAGEELATRLGPGVSFLAADVSVEADVRATVAHALDRFGRLDVLVNNAGNAGTLSGALDVDLDEFRRTFDVHVLGTVAGIKHVGPHLVAQGHGSIVNVSSVGGLLAGWTPYDYAAAKAAVTHLTRCAAVELGEHGVRVNSISPGPIPTGIQTKTAGADPEAAARSVDKLAELMSAGLASWQPVRRLGTPDDVAATALWLASDASSFVNGQDIAVDGGLTAGRPASVSAEAYRHIGALAREAADAHIT